MPFFTKTSLSLLAFFIFFGSTIGAQPEDWTQQVIKQADRFFDFKTVAKGTKSEHRFELYNPCADNLHIASVSESCACVTAFILDDKTELQTYETATLVAHFHTENEEGVKGATITVFIDKPQRAEIQLNIQGNIRSDISMSQREIIFGSVKEGQAVERTIDVVYTGRSTNWQIVDFSSKNEHLSGEIVERKPIAGGSSTKVKIKLAADAPRGVLNERFYLLSNDRDQRRELPILVSATVGKVLTVTPQSLFLGFLKPGEASRKGVVAQIRCTEPVKITKVESDDPNVEIDFTPDRDAPPRSIHRIPVVFRNPPEGSPKLNKETGILRAVIKIDTDDPQLKASFNVTAQVID